MLCRQQQAGDILMKVNDVDVTNISHSQAISLIKSSGGPTVNLLLRKGDGTVPDL